MNKVLNLLFVSLIVFSLAACTEVQNTGSKHDNVIPFSHVNGEGNETEKNVYVLFEFEQISIVKYQIAYLACT